VFVLEGQNLFQAGVKIDSTLAGGATVFVEDDPDFGETPHWRSECTFNIPPGQYEIQPFGMRFEVDGEIRAMHPSLSAEGKTLKIHLTPVTFRGTDAATNRPAPLGGLSVMTGRSNLVDGLLPSGIFNALTMWLPRGQQYTSSLGNFSIDNKGTIFPAPGGEPFKDGAFVQNIEPVNVAAVPAPAKGLWLAANNLRQVFKRGETVPMNLIASGAYPAGQIAIKARSESGTEFALGKVTLPEVKGVDSRLILVNTRLLPAGKYQLSLDHPDAKPYSIDVVDVYKSTPIFLHALSCCNGADFTLDPAGVAELKAAGVSAWISFGHSSVTGDGGMQNGFTTQRTLDMPTGAPAEFMRKIPTHAQVFENTLRGGMFTIDYANRRASFYNEGLAFHHTHQLSVERMIRRTHLFVQESEEFPAFRGLTYTWFPALHGYTEGGVPTDPYFATRVEVLNKKLKDELKIEQLTPDEARSLNTDGPAKHPQLVEKNREYFRAFNRLGFYESFKLYNAKMREVRPDFIATTHENAGHDAGKSTKYLYAAHDATSYESYTDYGDWYMSTPTVIDWGRAHNPDKPVWYAIDGTQPVSAQAGKAFYALARGAEGIGTPARGVGGMRANRKLGQLNAFLAAYGSLVTAMERDPSVAVLAPEMDFGMYNVHALYSHLCRLGHSPTILAEQTIEERGVPEGTKVIFLPNPKAPFSSKAHAALTAFIAGGGKIVVVGEAEYTFEGATQLKLPLQTLWDVGGFPFHLKMWEQFHAVRPALEKQMADLGLSPKNGAAPEQAVILPMRSAGVDYVAVISSPADTKDTEFFPVTGVPVQVGAAKRVINLVTGKDVEINDGAVKINLESEPAALLALLSEEVGAVTLKHPKTAEAGNRLELVAAAEFGERLVPMSVVLSDPSGAEVARFYTLSGKPVSYDLSNVTGTFTVAAAELISGKRVTATIEVTEAKSASVAMAADVYVPTPERLKAFLDRQDELRIVVEDTQPEVLAEAEKLADAFTSAGRTATVLRVEDSTYDTYWLRWIPRRSEEKVMAAIDGDQIVGFRGNMTPFIQHSTRTHVPAKGGWTDILPSYIVRKDVIVFSGGKIADSLSVASYWLGGPNTPGTGNAAVAVVLSPFWADRQAVAITARDPAGRQKAVDLILAALADRSKIPAANAFAEPTVALATESVSGNDAVVLNKPLRGFVPPAVVKRLSVSVDGFVAAQTRRATVMVSPDGKLVGAVSYDASAFAPAVARGGSLVRGLTHKLAEGAWHMTTEWRVSFSKIDPATGKALTFDLPGRFDRAAGFMKSFYDGFVVAPDGANLFASQLGGGAMLLDLASGKGSIVPFDAKSLGFPDAVRDPVFATSVAWAPDGASVAVSTGHNPTGYGGMGGEPEDAFSTAIGVIDVKTGKYRWQRGTSSLRDSSLAAINGMLAASEGARRVAYMDCYLTPTVLDESGKILWTMRTLPEGIAPKSLPKGLRTAISRDGKTAMFAVPGRVIVWRDGAEVVDFPVADLCDALLSDDGSRIYVANIEGGVTTFDATGAKQWEHATAGDQPRLALVPAGLVVGEGAGNLLLLNQAGAVKWSVDVKNAAPVSIDETREQVTGNATYREPPTMDVLTRLAGAKPVAAAELSGEAESHFGKKFFPGGSSLTLSANGPGWHLVRLVYRHDQPKTTVKIETGSTVRTFELDLPTPEYRVVMLPVESEGTVKVTVAGEGLKVAELKIYQYNVGANGALIASAGEQNIRGELSTEEEEPKSALDMDMDVLDDTDASSVAASKAGKMKDVQIFSFNTDVDRVAGPFFRESGNALEAFDGQRFEIGKPSAWTRWKPNEFMSYMGSRVVINLGYAARPKMCLTYDRTLKQSEVVSGIAVCKGDKDSMKADPDNIMYNRSVLAGVIENDQFFLAFDLGGSEIGVIGVYVFAGTDKDHGLSEVELSE